MKDVETLYKERKNLNQKLIELDKMDTENMNLRAESLRLQQELDRQSKNT